MSDVVIQAAGLSKVFREGANQLTIFSGIDFRLQEGEAVAIVGSSGAGKTTLLNLLGGLDKPTEGEVLICGESIHRLNERKKARLRNQHLGFVYQFHHLLPEFTALENVAMPLLMGGKNTRDAKQAASRVLTLVGLKDRLSHKPPQLSGGERQRVAIARAIVAEPRCVLMDEPTGNLDENTAESVQELIMKLRDELKTAFVIVTHHSGLAERMDRQWMLEHGSLHVRAVQTD